MARLFAVWFEGPSRQYARLAAVLSLTARRWCPEWDIEVRQLRPHGLRAASGSESDAANHHKLTAWAREVALLPDGAELLLVDADTFVTGPLHGIWAEPFDVAYTARAAGYRYPLNAGVIAVRGGEAARAFFDGWIARDALFLRDVEARRPWRALYGGQNQASLGALLEGEGRPPRAHVTALPCARWNCEDTTWSAFGEATSLVHVKSALRMAAFAVMGSTDEHVRRLARMWRALDAEATANEIRSGFTSRADLLAAEASA